MVLFSGKYEGTVEAMGAPKDLYVRALAVEQKEFREKYLNIASIYTGQIGEEASVSRQINWTGRFCRRQLDILVMKEVNEAIEFRRRH